MNTSTMAVAAAIVGALTFSAGASAQNTQNTPASPVPEAIQNAPPERMIENPAAPREGVSGALQTPLSDALVGAEVVDASGDTIGKVERVENDQLVVSTGGFLGIGKRSVMLSRDQVTIPPGGSGDEMQVVTSLSEEQLKALPEATGSSAGDTPSRTPAAGPDATSPAGADRLGRDTDTPQPSR